MYLSFFNFKEDPFRITPDPRFLFLSRQHEEAIGSLHYGINERKGFIAVIGDVGTGKTTICRALLSKLDKNIDTSLILNPMLSVQELLEAINEDFGNRSATSDSIKGQIDALNKFLLRRLRWNKNAVVIIDEAQNLSVEALEMVRMLSNLETDNKKLLQIMLVGQPELHRKLQMPELRQLNQRISVRYFLGALNYLEASSYIAHRVSVAGGAGFVRFDDASMRKIYDYSKGVPRLINIICDRALLTAYAERKRLIDKQVVRTSISDVEGRTNAKGFASIDGGAKKWWNWVMYS